MARLIPACLASLILGAHFLRQGGLMMAGICLALPLLALFVRRLWALRPLQGLLWFGVFIWTAAALELGQERMAAGRPFMRMACILGGVAVFTAVAAWLLGRPALLERYGRKVPLPHRS